MPCLTFKAFQSDHRVRRACRMAQIAAVLSELDAKCARPPDGSDLFVSMTSCERQQGGTSCTKSYARVFLLFFLLPNTRAAGHLRRFWPHLMLVRTDPAIALDYGVARSPFYVHSFTSKLIGSRAAQGHKRQAQFYVSLPQAHAHSPFFGRIARPPAFSSLRARQPFTR